jgi:hypothetical protein
MAIRQGARLKELIEQLLLAAREAVLQVLGNLLDNAAKYSPDHGPSGWRRPATARWPCWASATRPSAARAPASSSACP